MTGSIIIHTNSTKNYNKQVHSYDCCQSLGDQINMYKGHNGYAYICIIPIDKVDDFFKVRKNMVDYVAIIDKVFDMESVVLEDVGPLSEEIKSANPFDENYYVEIIAKKKRSNKEWVAYHNALRYTWYLHYSNIATACVNLSRLNILPDAMSILAIASSYQTQEGRALLPTVLSNVDSFIYFPDKEKVLVELSNNTPFNTAFMRTPIYYDPKIRISGNFFSDAPPVVLSAKNLLGPLGDVDDISEIPDVILNGIKKSLESYVSIRPVYDQIVEFFKKNGKSGTEKIIITDKHIEKNEITIKVSDPFGNTTSTKLNFKI